MKEKVNSLCEEKFDLVVNLNFSRLSAIFFSSIYGKVKIGAGLLDADSIYINSRVLRELFFEIDECKREEHILNYYFKALNIEPCINVKFPSLPKDQDLKRIVFHPGASSEKKRWGIKNYFNLSKLIIDKMSGKVEFIITGSKDEFSSNKVLAEKIKSLKVKVENLSGKLSLLEILEVIRDSDFLISSDTAIAHLSALTDTKSITIFLGGAYHHHTFPYQINKIVVYPELECYPCGVREKCKYGYRCKEVILPEDIFKIIEGEKIRNSKFTTLVDGFIYLK